MLFDFLLEFEAGMVRAQGDAHGSIIASIQQSALSIQPFGRHSGPYV
jgi:hypothetical protein